MGNTPLSGVVSVTLDRGHVPMDYTNKIPKKDMSTEHGGVREISKSNRTVTATATLQIPSECYGNGP